MIKTRMVDVREYPEYAAGHIEGSELVPLGSLEKTSSTWDHSDPITLICRSGRRAEQARQLLARRGFQSLSVLEGGVDAWKREGKSLAAAVRSPWSLERQVRIVAGSLVLIFFILGSLASRQFFAGAGLVGAGLLYAGVSDNCMMASLLGRMPWNDQSKASA